MRLTLRSYFLYDAERDLLAIAKFLVMYRQQLITLTLLDYAQCGLCLEKNNKHSRERICFYDTRQILQLSSGLCGEKLVLCLAVLPGIICFIFVRQGAVQLHCGAHYDSFTIHDDLDFGSIFFWHDDDPTTVAHLF